MRKELEQDTGVLLNSVAPASPAEKEGLEVGDIVVKLGGDSILSPDDLAVALRSDLTGKATDLQLIRGVSLQEPKVEIELGEEG